MAVDPEKQSYDLAKKLNVNVERVIGSENMAGFERAYLIAFATQELKQMLSPEYMKPILALQGTKLGFKTDKDNDGGYLMETVKNCLIEAVLTGVQPFGNQFNIIAGNCYITKEGFGYLLNNRFPGLAYEIIPDLPRIKADNSGAAIVMNIRWSINGGEQHIRKLDIPVRMNKQMGTDAVIGKATRKARAWLYNTISGNEISDGDATDIDARVVSSVINGQENVAIEDLEMLFDMKKDSLTPDELANAQRIIDNKEEASYKKLKAQLQAK